MNSNPINYVLLFVFTRSFSSPSTDDYPDVWLHGIIWGDWQRGKTRIIWRKSGVSDGGASAGVGLIE